MRGEHDPLSRTLVLLLALPLLLGAVAARAATLSISCGALGVELRLCREGVDAWAQQTGNTVDVISTPNSSTERFALYQQILASHSADLDILQIDVVWPGTLAPHLVDLAQYIPPDVTKEYFPALIANNTVNGRLVAMPWFTNAGVLYYRADLLKKYGAKPPAPPARESTKPSVRSCRMMRQRPPPSARRMAISFLRATARESSRPATFAHAISRISPAASISANAFGRRVAVSPFCNGTH